MAGKQFATYALDVRGFGAWQSETGKQTVNFDKALADVKAVIKILKTRHPGLPVFLLGESMGGAIALRAASEYGNEMAGVVASVPSAERYGEAEMAVNVAIHYLNDRKKQINMASIAKKATSNEELREFWKDDLRSRTRLSPLELIKFDHFMKTTQHRCSSITDTPVMLVQGLSDQLVKPQGTYEMYDNIKSPDKVMIIIGNAEHLIFETPEQPQILLGGLDAWLKHHCAKPAH
jgi:alpha-beta hydrolase superfamily lysophospholipase